jgi:2-methylcitrate dehydratase PrpD
MTQAAEDRLAEFVLGQEPRHAPDDIAQIVKLCLVTSVSTAIAGAAEDGVAEILAYANAQGGRAEATTLVFGDRLPAASAALVNGMMCRALDYCDAMAPGLHIGSALIPAALAAAELAGGCTGAQLLDALIVGAEVGARFNLDGTQYDGFDPTGVAGVFGATAACARLLGLSPGQTRNALALAFNRCGGSFQSNVDGSLAVRLIQGWVAESAVTCARLAKAGLTGPDRFLTGGYGYLHLFARDRTDAASMLAGLGTQWRLDRMVFKRFPSCGGTQAVTKLALDLITQHPFIMTEVDSVRVMLPPYTYRLVGHPLRLGPNPRVDAQFSAQYCVASALIRRGSRLADFRPAAVREPAVLKLADRIEVEPAERLGTPGNPIAVLQVRTTDGKRYESSIDIPPGFPGNGLTDAEHAERLADCLHYAPFPLSAGQAEAFRTAVQGLADLPDARDLLSLLVHRPSAKRDRRIAGAV